MTTSVPSPRALRSAAGLGARQALLCALLGALASGCITGPPEDLPRFDPGADNHFRSALGLAAVRVEVSGERPVQGSNTFLLDVSPADGVASVEVADASIFMPAHGHGTERPTLESPGPGHYRLSEVLLFMPGRWELTLSLDADGEADWVAFAVDVR